MDINTLLGYLLGAGLFAFAFSDNSLRAVFLNEHGILLVFGGTIAATLVSTPPRQLLLALRGLGDAFFPTVQPNPKSQMYKVQLHLRNIELL